MASINHSLEEPADPFSMSTIRMMLQSCQLARRGLQERISVLEDNLTHKKMLLDSYQLNARTYKSAVKTCMEDKAVVAAECAKLENEIINLTMAHEQSAKEPTSTEKSRASIKKSKDLKGN